MGFYTWSASIMKLTDGEMKRAERQWRDAFDLPNTLDWPRLTGAARR